MVLPRSQTLPSEVCTGAQDQINICWASAHDLLLNISSGALQDTYSSLSSAQPSASSWSFDPQTLIASTQTTSTSTTRETSSSTTTPVSSASSTSSSSSSSSPSGGAIAGIVIGALAALALIGAAIWFLMRHRRKKTQTVPAQQNFPTAPAYSDEVKTYEQRQELGAEESHSALKREQEDWPPQELEPRDSHSGSKREQEYLLPQELPAGSPPQRG
ncbi:MAG: hypothetical protein Q9227_004989 [Pyrenula ochraceoflavens]